MVPSEPTPPDKACELDEVRERVRAAVAALPPRERRVVGLYYFGEVTMKEIGSEIGVNESRVSQLHARAIQRLRKLLGPDVETDILSSALAQISDATNLRMVKARLRPTQKLMTTNQEEARRVGILVSHAEARRRRASAKRVVHVGKPSAVA
tara:strand:+ start:187 stop:642 length:456 start_codon:yes stop_codon:yes gene_type:complete